MELVVMSTGCSSGVFPWASYLGGLGAAREGEPGPLMGQSTQCTSPCNGPSISESWPEPDMDSEMLLPGPGEQ